MLQQAEADFDPLPFDDRSARAFGRVAASLRTSGRTVKARSYDAMVAAIAIANDLPLIHREPLRLRGHRWARRQGRASSGAYRALIRQAPHSAMEASATKRYAGRASTWQKR